MPIQKITPVTSGRSRIDEVNLTKSRVANFLIKAPISSKGKMPAVPLKGIVESSWSLADHSPIPFISSASHRREEIRRFQGSPRLESRYNVFSTAVNRLG